MWNFNSMKGKTGVSYYFLADPDMCFQFIMSLFSIHIVKLQNFDMQKCLCDLIRHSSHPFFLKRLVIFVTNTSWIHKKRWDVVSSWLCGPVSTVWTTWWFHVTVHAVGGYLSSNSLIPHPKQRTLFWGDRRARKSHWSLNLLPVPWLTACYNLQYVMVLCIIQHRENQIFTFSQAIWHVMIVSKL
jgi:hypothetical protein